MPTPDRRFACGLMLAGGLLAAAPAGAATQQEIAERAVVQEGLAIGLATNVLQSQLEILFDSIGGTAGTCSKLLTGGTGSVEIISINTVSKTVTQAEVTVFYDDACKKPYIAAQATITAGSLSSLSAAETATYTGPTGTALGTLTLNETAALNTSGGYDVLGTGTFAPAAAGTPSVSLGLQCSIPSGSTPFPCTGGVAQDFPKLNRSIASLTELMLTVATKKPRPVTFTGNSTKLLTGALGALSIGETKTALAIDGTGRKFGSTTAVGSAGGFTLFPPTPTTWSVSDTGHDLMFSISVVSNTTKSLTGSVKTISTGTTLATFTLDKSGTGKISYGGGKLPITSWTLSD